MKNKGERRSFLKKLLPFSAFFAGSLFSFQFRSPAKAHGKGNDIDRIEALEKRIQVTAKRTPAPGTTRGHRMSYNSQ
jgi:hypothetical protein